MGSLADYAENKMVDHLLGTAYTPAATIYLALCTADPTDAATGASMNEVANSGGYARTAITFGAASSRRVTQSAEVDFGTSSGSWGTVTHWAIVDNGTYGAGNVLAHGAFGASKSVPSGRPVSVASGQIYVEISAGEVSDYAANGFLDRMFRNQAFTVSATHVGLATATISDTTTGSTVTEVSGGSYAREQVNVAGGASPAWSAASGGAASNANDIDFGTTTASWGTVTSVFIADAASGGNILLYDNGMTDEAIGSGDTVLFAAGDLDVSMS